jgi:pimeloyl-ACP methyl ester carboxylesterase
MSSSPFRTEAALREAMRDQRYWQTGHPERQAHVASVTRGFQELYAGEGEATQRVVHVRAHQRTRHGEREDVSAYDQRRRGRRRAERRPASPSLIEPPAPPAPPVTVPAIPPTFVAYIGGGGDGQTGIVAGERNRSGDDLGQRDSRYYSHQDADRVIADLLQQPAGTRLVVIGHSWGGDTALQVANRLAQQGRRVDTLVTIDPVGRGVTDGFLARARASTGEWINVRATGGSLFEWDNVVARIGSRYGDSPAPHATHHFEVSRAHGDFRNLLRLAGPDGRSALDWALGR